MKIYTAKYKAEQPCSKELHVPTDSKYGVGLQFERDGQPWDLLPGEVTLDGLSADDVVDGTFIFERTSGGRGQKVGAVRAADMGVHETVEGEVAEQSIRKRAVNTVSFVMPLSSVTAGPVEVTAKDIEYSTRYAVGEDPTGDYVVPSMFTIFPTSGNFPQVKKFKSEPDALYVQESASSPNNVKVQSVVVNPEGRLLATTQTYSATAVVWHTQSKATLDTADTIRDYKLTETTEDQGVALGFNENYVLKDAIELSGTYEDDSEFDYRLPTTI